ncbi:hypothetical protein AAY473_030975 [Plecturocebus cupreus]
MPLHFGLGDRARLCLKRKIPCLQDWAPSPGAPKSPVTDTRDLALNNGHQYEFKNCLDNIVRPHLNNDKNNNNQARWYAPAVPATQAAEVGGSLEPERLEGDSSISAHHNLRLLGSSNSSASASQVARITGMRHHIQLILRSLTPSPRLECSGVVLADSNLRLLGSSNSPKSAPRVAGITSTHHHAQLVFVFLVEMRFHLIDQAGLKFLTSGDPPTLASQTMYLLVLGMQEEISIIPALGAKPLAAENQTFQSLEQTVSSLGRAQTSATHNPATPYKAGSMPYDASVPEDHSELHWQRRTIKGLALLPSLECSGAMVAHCNLELLGSNIGSHCVAQVALELWAQAVLLPGPPKALRLQRRGFAMLARLVSNSLSHVIPPTSASKSAGMTGVSHHTRPIP